MDWASWAVCGFGATVILTTILAISQGIKWTRLSIPLMLGTMFTPDRDKAKWKGIFIQLCIGYLFSLIYVATFEVLGGANWEWGAFIGFINALFVLALVLPNLPAVHPRMASEYYIADQFKYLEPPGFFALNYGLSTPLAVIGAHAIFGAILGTFYNI